MCDQATTTGASHSDAIDTLVSALADEHHRHVLWYFQEIDDPIATVDDLVDYAAEGRPADNREHIEITLHHVTLPKLADSGVITYDARNCTVRYLENPLLERMLGRVTDEDRSE